MTLDHPFAIRASSLILLVDEVYRYLKKNKREIPEDLAAIVEDQIARRFPHFSTVHIRETVYLSFRMVATATELMLDMARRQNLFVDPEVAEERARECAACPMNVHTSICMSCTGLYAIIEQWFGGRGRKTKVDDILHLCSVCGCANKAQVHVDASILKRLTQKELREKYPEKGCWKRRLLS